MSASGPLRYLHLHVELATVCFGEARRWPLPTRLDLVLGGFWSSSAIAADNRRLVSDTSGRSVQPEIATC